MHSGQPNLAHRLSEGWVSLNQLSKILGITYPTVMRLRKQGRVRVVLVGGIFRVYADEVKRLLAEGTSKIVAEPEPDAAPQKKCKTQQPLEGD